jgi:hypothetical protein
MLERWKTWQDRPAFYINLVFQALGIIYVGLMQENKSHGGYKFTTHYIYEYFMFEHVVFDYSSYTASYLLFLTTSWGAFKKQNMHFFARKQSNLSQSNAV